MAFLTVGKEPPKKKQRLYIMEIELPSGMKVVKIGKASGSSSKERMLQINGSIFDKFRCTAKISIKRDREVPADEVFKYETILHQFFAKCQYEHKTKWDGVTECFAVPVDDVVQAYELVITGVVPDFLYELPEPKEEDGLPFKITVTYPDGETRELNSTQLKYESRQTHGGNRFIGVDFKALKPEDYTSDKFKEWLAGDVFMMIPARASHKAKYEVPAWIKVMVQSHKYKGLQ